jgi:aquaporin Z
MYEFFGTFIITFALNASEGNAICVGLTLYFLYMLINPFTGCHVNPAVSLGIWLNMDKSYHTSIQLVNYFLAQICGACMSSVLIFELGTFSDKLLNNPSTDNMSQAFVIEMFVTFIFVYSVLIVKDARASLFHNHGNPNPKLGWYGAMTIGLSLAAMIMMAGEHTGSAINPAVSIA